MKNVVILLAQGFEEVEAISPIDYLRRAGVNLTIVAVPNGGNDTKTVSSAHNVSIVCDEVLSPAFIKEHATALNMVILPGGIKGAEGIAKSADARILVEKIYSAGGYIAAICAAPAVVLDAWGLLHDKKFTCHPSVENKLGDARVCCVYEPVVQDKTLITSRGAGTAEEFAFALIRVLCGKKKVSEIESQICARHISA